MAVIRNRAAEADLTFRVGAMDDTVLKVVHFNGTEGISQLYQFTLELASKDGEIDFAKVLGEAGLLTIQGDPEPRYVSGIVSRFEQAGRGTDFTRYRATLVPALWLLTQRQNFRIFQEKSVPDIVKAVLEEAKVPSDTYRFSLKGTYKPREYCVQYRQSDMDFISYLLEEEGICFYFEHKETGHVVVFGDGPDAHTDIVKPTTVLLNDIGFGTTTEEFIQSCQVTQEIRSGKSQLQDYDFTKPSLDLTASADGDKWKELETYDYPGGYQEKGVGTELAKRRREEGAVPADVMTAHSDCRRLVSGYKFTLDGHERSSFNQSYLVTAVQHYGFQPQAVSGEETTAVSGQPTYENDIECIPAKYPFRPPRVTPRPMIPGTQTALVVGPSGEEIHTDKNGRIKAKFHWNRSGINDDKASCWIRVSQPLAGSGYGCMFLPRVGQEVVVTFEEGDPDRPLITGSVYNGDQVPPYALPDNKTRSVIKTNSSKGGGGSNEISFEDKKGSEQLLFHAEKDLDFRVKNDRREHIGNDRHLVVVRDKIQKVERDEHSLVARDQVTEISRDHSLKVGKKQSIEIGDSRSITVKGDVIEAYKKNYSQEVGSDLYIKAMGLVIEGMKEVTIKVGGSFLKVDSSGVTVSGPQIKLNSGGSAGSGKMGKALSAVAPLEAAVAATVVTGKDFTYSKPKTVTDPIVAKALDAPTHKDPTEDEEEKSWLEVELIDDADQPVAGEKVMVTLPDGKVYTGRTGPDGVLKVTGVEKGADCKITFPDLDKEAWEKA
jgi:type VI secretion system secreted protein VgrG